MNTTVICFGDSNTWGYEPISGGRYPAKDRWVDILAAKTGCTAVNIGLNGRQIPHTEAEIREVTDILDDVNSGKYTKPAELWILLGVNDIQMNYGFTAERVAERMKNLLLVLLRHPAVTDKSVKIRILGPAQTKVGPWSDERQVSELRRCGLLYKNICRELSVDYTDLGQTDIELAPDGDHFSAKGHKTVADFLAGLL